MTTLLDILYGSGIQNQNVTSLLDGSSLSIHDIHQRVHNFASHLQSSGIQKSNRVVIVSDNNPDFLCADYATLLTGAISVPVDQSIIENPLFSDYLAYVKPEMIVAEPKYARVLGSSCMGVPVTKIPESQTWFGVSSTYFRPEIHDDDVATIIFSSGSSASAKRSYKGICLTHNNIASNILASDAYCKKFKVGTYLTGVAHHWHSFEYMVQKAALFSGVNLRYTNRDGLMRHSHGQQINPDLMLMIPSLANTIKSRILRKMKKSKGEKFTALFEFLTNKSADYMQNYCENGWPGLLNAGIHTIAEPLVYKKLRAELEPTFGNRKPLLLGGGAPLDISTQRFFAAIGLPIYQGYGLTETSPVISFNSPSHYRFGSSGKVIDGVEVQVRDVSNGDVLPVNQEGLLYIKGPNVFSHYWDEEELTEAAFDGDWFNTGDIGKLDKDSFLYVTGRHKSLLCLATGEKVQPDLYESSKQQVGSIAHLMCVGEGYNRVGALIVPQAEQLAQLQSGSITLEDLSKQYAMELADANVNLGASIGPIHIITDFDANRYLTAKKTLKRSLVLEDYAEQIENMYKRG